MATLVRPGLAGLRDRAILLLAFSLAARRSELVALDVEDIEECPEGLGVRIRTSKTEQEGVGAAVAVCCGSIACPVAAVLDYVKAANITSGALTLRFSRVKRSSSAKNTSSALLPLLLLARRVGAEQNAQRLLGRALGLP
jgi:hypothetical protein